MAMQLQGGYSTFGLFAWSATLVHAATAWHPAVEEFAGFASATLRSIETPQTWRLCTIGSPEHIVEIGRWMMQEIAPSIPIEIILYAASSGPQLIVETLVAEMEHRIGIANRLGELRGACNLVLLQVSPPKFNPASLQDLLLDQQQQPSALAGDHLTVAHLGRSCDQRQKACRMFQHLWHRVTGEQSNCGEHLCFGRLQAEELYDDWLSQVDCARLRSNEAPPSQVSQWQQDWFVYHNFVKGTILDTAARDDAVPFRQGVFVDVGAFHPVHLSNTFFFEHCLGWRGVCVEPNPDAEVNFASYRPHCSLVQNCVWSAPRNVVMSYAKDPIEAYIQEPTSGAAAVSGAVLIKDNATRPAFTSVCRTLEDILTSAGLQRPTTIDFMSVDTEAAEVEVFRTFPFQDFDISVIVVEVQVKNFYDLDVIFLSNGYGKVGVLGGDHVYAKLPRQLDLPANWNEWQQILSKNFYAHAKPKTVLLQRDRWDDDAT